MHRVPSLPHLVVLLLIAAAASAVADFFFVTRSAWGQCAVTAVAGVGAIVLSLRWLKVLDDRLHARVLAQDGGDWSVWVNGVCVGSIPDRLRAMFQREALHAPELITQQLLNVLKTLVTVANYLFTALPLSAFWIAVVGVAFYPDEIRTLLKETSSIEALSMYLRSELVPITVLSLVSCALMFAIGYRFGLRNVYDEFLARTIRQYCNTPAEGDVTLRPERVQSLESKQAL